MLVISFLMASIFQSVQGSHTSGAFFLVSALKMSLISANPEEYSFK